MGAWWIIGSSCTLRPIWSQNQLFLGGWGWGWGWGGSHRSRSPLKSPHKRLVTRSFDIFFDLHLKQQFSKQWRRQWFRMPSRSLWRHCNDTTRRSHVWNIPYVVIRWITSAHVQAHGITHYDCDITSLPVQISRWMSNRVRPCQAIW